MKLDISEGCYIRLRNGEIRGPVTFDNGVWRNGELRWLETGRAYSDGELHSFDIVATMTERDAINVQRAIDITDMSFSADQFNQWLNDVREVAPNITNKEIAKGIGRSDQWISNASSTGVNHHSALALWFYLDTLQTNCNVESKGSDNVQNRGQC